MYSKKTKLIFGAIAVLFSFFLVTFLKNWGTAVAEKNKEDLAPLVSKVKNNRGMAMQMCPKLISRLKKGIPDLQKNNASGDVLESYKLIADCEMASGQYHQAAKTFATISQSEPQFARWHNKQAEALMKAGKAGEALPKSHLAVQLEPQKFTYRILNARILVELGLTNKAIAAYHEAIRLAPYGELEKTKVEFKEFISRTSVADKT